MADDNSIILTADQVRRWEREKEDLQRSIAAAQERLSFINRRLDAVAVLMGEETASMSPEAVEPAVEPTAADAGDQEPEETMVDAIQRIARESTAPVSKADMRDLLRSLGHAESRLGNYFYTAVARLKQRNRIRVLPNGSITRPDDSEAQEHEAPESLV